MLVRQACRDRSDVLIVASGTAPFLDLPAGMIFSPLGEVRRRIHGAFRRVDVCVQRNFVVFANAWVVCQAGREDDGKHLLVPGLSAGDVTSRCFVPRLIERLMLVRGATAPRFVTMPSR